MTKNQNANASTQAVAVAAKIRPNAPLRWP
jgi:hypothetical protein